MRKDIVLIILLAGLTVNTFAQSEHKLIRRGNRAYSKNDYLESEVQYREALERNKHSFKANFNLGDALYKQNKFSDSDSIFNGINTSALSDADKSMIYYNKGNSLFKQNKFKESADAYKMALKYNPNDIDAKYNLSEALRMMQNQQNQNNNQQQNNSNDNKDNKDQKDDKKQDKKEDKKDNNNNKQDNQQNNQNKNNQQQQQPKISKEDAERMLQALQQREKDIQDKLNKKQAKPVSGASIKNW
ncbi:MAG: tetratricopeptide repeat protein [Tenuifilum sp.]|uniref:tetratricopeptide repeat protein n=1 Tax=Tenuifilum sp. TaxID=2760880 RepID=UPI002C47AE92|nr:tetratricopeptide repeat protein [Tenuifilum sp.]